VRETRLLRSCWLVTSVASCGRFSCGVGQCESSTWLPGISLPCAMGGRFLRSMACAERWRQKGTNCRSLPLTVTGRELLPLQSQRQWILQYFPSPDQTTLLVAGAGKGASSRHRQGRYRASPYCFSVAAWAAARAARNTAVPYVLSPRGSLVKDLIARRSRLAKSAWIHLIERPNVEQAAALHLTSELERTEL